MRRLEVLPSDLPPVEPRARLPGGFVAGAMAVGIKASGRPDLGVLATTGRPASVAATFTTNQVPAAPIRLTRANLAATGGHAAAVLCTSGCANAATGEAGDRDQAALGSALADRAGVDPELTVAISTGLIGSRLPVDAIRAGLARLVPAGLAATDAAFAALGEQMRTTDSRAKSASVEVRLPGAAAGDPPVLVSGVAKGVGMIHPRMATMLALVATDANVAPPTLAGILGPAVERTWNQLTVDGDTSTNDTVLLLASGAAGGTEIAPGTAAHAALARAIESVARSLARQQAADGEGATTLITCQASGARTDVEARAAARSVVASSLLKAAIHGRDPNWGRIVAAIGNAVVAGAPIALDPDRLAVAIAGVPVFDGAPLEFDRAAVSRRMDAPEVLLRVDLGLGDGSGEAFGCDLTEAYVVENAAYST
ncbi:MAG TPA: bifunctional glutamate N-acetyltransferase/amino-acid acetyltransferase ArgJ [Candidatus Dormibacteraeota bacterium]|nr:bifunctional glutamate N-acetyltransferase/amino-acid acetyltransferase ArgJ [Candidatus Dormibacteraeota bacterium]